MAGPAYCAIYDFELLPYALGDVLTWNIQTAMQCEQAGRSQVDAYICMDQRYPASIYQRGLVVSENCGLYFNELFGAFGTHPILGNIHLFGSRDQMLEQLRQVSADDPLNAIAVADYERVLGHRDNENELNTYFIKYIYSHSRLNQYGQQHGRIPLLHASRGCEPDVQGLLRTLFAGKRIVIVHPRLRRLDKGLAGEHTYFRDSDFLEWYEFIRSAGKKHPDVRFVVVGRMQEKPIELLKLPNVVSIRTFGLGLGHELTLMLHADFFLGTSSGFAAMANFSQVPYFITRMNKESCNAYAIEPGSSRLPFAGPNQLLVYEPETADMLMRLLEQGLAWPARQTSAAAMPTANSTLGVKAFEQNHAQWLYPAATTSRFYIDDAYADQETAFLIWPKLQEAYAALSKGDPTLSAAIAGRISNNFPRLHEKLPGLNQLLNGTAKPPPAPPLRDRFKQYISTLNSNILPARLRGSFVHHIARRVKRRLFAQKYR